MSRATSTALSDFSTACWALRPITWSACVSSGASVSAARRSPSACSRNSRAAAARSGADKNAALAPSALDDGAANACPRLGALGGHHHDVERAVETVQEAPKPD